MLKTDWDARFLGLAQYVSEWSKDPSSQVGAVIVGLDKRDVCHGFNGFPPGITDTPERLNDRPTKYRLTQHAERNALDNCRFDTRGATLYVTRCPCSECTKSIISKGIARVVYMPHPEFDARWAEELDWSRKMLMEVGIPLIPMELPK